MSFKNLVCFAITLAVVCAPVFAAGGDDGDWELGLFAGQAFLDDYDRTAAPTLALDDDTIFGLRVGYWFTQRWSLEGSWQNVGTMTGFAMPTPNLSADLDSYRLNALANFNADGKWRPFVTLGLGKERLSVSGLLSDDDVSPNLGGGVRWQATDAFGLRWDARFVRTDFSSALSGTQNNLETTLGAAWTFGGSRPTDSDGDGVSDRKDRCPDTPRGATVDENGCPADSDGDGVFDGLDKCPDTPKGHTVDKQGCSRDSDGDGVMDGLDRCPDSPKGATVDAKGCAGDDDNDGVANGIDRCPDTPKGATVDAKGCPKDSDKDGVFDGLDKCPDTPKGATVDAQGCPADDDKDGVWNGIDRCPDTAAGIKVDAKGCAVLFEEEQKMLVLDNVFFEFNSDELTADSKRVLDAIVPPLVESFKGVQLEVGGHTDSVGSAKYNRDLSQRRAESVVAHLVTAGVDADRLSARGYGEDQPAADNGTDAGRAKNRRVELRRVN